jgi:hypothetical protein
VDEMVVEVQEMLDTRWTYDAFIRGIGNFLTMQLSPKLVFWIEDTVRISGYFEAHSQIREALNPLKMPKLANNVCDKDEPKML